ncbi:hypothetical protein N7U66_07580 [Lacinutrix neustonica]|uniref:Uncharacterized protein n=1 Tax=Lacinutrix neustonica TaxID=2980107 RepID=A0A9E8MYT1_9FLAO|nr:hypothetical protein [Lacinutrix neustonica]WAC03384.1 hypothetical protein N7U66_07580 [Lacinutrix neustonica]
MRIHYNNAIDNTGEKVELKIFVVNSLCKYLGYASFSDYEKKEPVSSFNTSENFFIKNKIKIILTFALVSTALIIASFTIETQKWMVWKNDHYEEVPFDIEKYNIREIKVYNKNRILSFRKTIPDCKTVYFKTNGHENLWYGKNHNKELEFFTALGLHPRDREDAQAYYRVYD